MFSKISTPPEEMCIVQTWTDPQVFLASSDRRRRKFIIRLVEDGCKDVTPHIPPFTRMCDCAGANTETNQLQKCRCGCQNVRVRTSLFYVLVVLACLLT